MYSNMTNNFLIYDRQHRRADDDPDIYNRYKSFLIFIGFDAAGADLEVAYFMNAVFDTLD
ncbi:MULTISPECIES: hypothetical protein [unclassified Paenibacillus]|uniref:hypothetical protein n=1 Tax=unclassified Paenibacillus TaxID=185978 RepID=UPI00020D79E0|nr:MULTISPECIES: hypothetical protein [unclassified Paenibacillus]EGL19744.1 hypothetical protein HMPREF9413_3570 [Paenibacillus sp. HGF7]EPD92238.1 hypothetical protein HMPREF1207_00905 [Paenibacillus sp. HGH0039]